LRAGGRQVTPRARRRASAGDRGALTIVAAALIGTVTSVTLAVAAAGGVLVERQRLDATADAAALAAADAASGVVSGIPCEAAAALAAANAAELRACLIKGAEADVEVSSKVGPFAVGAAARAGQPPPWRSIRTGASKK
jgi:secretion/DNA translocation related TadE-like protein